jgi:hypothetical protein
VRAEADEAARGLHEAIHGREREAQEKVDKMLADAGRDAKKLRDDAAAEAADARAKAVTASREIVAEAHAAARAVMKEGEELSAQLGELGGTLRTNATRLLRAVQAAHERLQGTLDGAAARGAEPVPRRRATPTNGASHGDGDGELGPTDTQTLDVPEFLPPSG